MRNASLRVGNVGGQFPVSLDVLYACRYCITLDIMLGHLRDRQSGGLQNEDDLGQGVLGCKGNVGMASRLAIISWKRREGWVHLGSCLVYGVLFLTFDPQRVFVVHVVFLEWGKSVSWALDSIVWEGQGEGRYVEVLTESSFQDANWTRGYW